MHLSVNYVTTCRYTAPAQRIVQMLRVTPLSYGGQNVLDWRIDVDSDARLRERRDGYGNVTHMLYIDHEVETLEIKVHGRVITEDRAGVVQGLPGDLPPQVFTRSTKLTQTGGSLDTLVHALAKHDDDRRVLLHHLTDRIYKRMTFDDSATGVGTTAAEAFEAAHGVCQDYVHIFIAAARALNIPTRYVSGHLFRRDGAGTQPATHAWAEAWDEPLNAWIAFDPTNGICADDAYVRVACGLDYRDAAPFSGSFAGVAGQELEVGVDVRDVRRQHQAQAQTAPGQSQSQSQN